MEREMGKKVSDIGDMHAEVTFFCAKKIMEKKMKKKKE